MKEFDPNALVKRFSKKTFITSVKPLSGEISMYRKIIFLVLLFGIGLQFAIAQNYPSFKITAYDTLSRGYYFLGPIKTGKGPTGNAAFMILDKTGKVVYYKILKKGQTVFDFKIQPNGLMSFTYGSNFYLMDSNFTIVDSVFCKNGVQTDLHDLLILPNGHFLLLGNENITKDLSQYPYFKMNGSIGSKNATVICGVIQELDKSKNVVFEWHAIDHYDFGDVDSFYLNNPAGVDWNHVNSVAQDADGNILLSLRHFNEVTKINRKDSSIIWRMGGKRNMFKFTNDSEKFLGQHDVRRIANGNITLLDNGRAAHPFHTIAAKEYSLDESALTATLVWSYVEDSKAYSFGTGNVQRLNNGNTLIDYGLFSGGKLIFNVVKPSGNKVFELMFDDSLLSYRSFNYSYLPWKLNRPQITCTYSGGKFYLDAGAGHVKYLWSNGDTTRTIAVVGADTFTVFVPIGDGGMISSEPFITSGHTDPCGLTGVMENNAIFDFSIFPNPVHDQLVFTSSSNQKQEIKWQIFDIAGKKMFESAAMLFGDHFSIPVHDLPNGIYIFNIDGVKRKIVRE